MLVCFIFDRFPNLEKRKKLFSQYAKACLNGHLPRSKSGGFGCPILPSQGSSRLVARRIYPVFSKPVERLVPEKAPTFHATLPSSVMFLVILEVENAVVFMRELAITSPAVGEVGRIAANPLVGAGSFHQWCTVISAKNDSAPRELVSLPSDRMS